MVIQGPTVVIPEHDYRRIIRDGISEEIEKRWPGLRHNPVECMQGGGYTYPQLQLGLPDECGYAFIHIMCGEDIFVDADGDYGPNMQSRYEDPDCVDNVLAFVMAILAVPRKDGKRQYAGEDTIDLREWRKKL